MQDIMLNSHVEYMLFITLLHTRHSFHRYVIILGCQHLWEDSKTRFQLVLKIKK